MKAYLLYHYLPDSVPKGPSNGQIVISLINILYFASGKSSMNQAICVQRKQTRIVALRLAQSRPKKVAPREFSWR